MRIVNCQHFWNWSSLTDEQIEALMNEVWAGTLGGARLDEAAICVFMTDIAAELRKRGHAVSWNRKGGSRSLFMDNYIA